MSVLDTLRVYDSGVVDWAKTFIVEGKPVKTILATPDRPWGRYETLDELRGSLMEGPIVSITRGDLVPDPSRQESSLAQIPILNRGAQYSKQYIMGKVPRPFRIQYQFDLRSRSRTYANFWTQWFYFLFDPEIVFTFNFGKPWGIKRIDANLLPPIVDNSDLESGEKERWIRHTATIELLAWMFISVSDLNSDIPDPFGQLTAIPDIRQVIVDGFLTSDLTKINIQDPDTPDFEVVASEVEESSTVPIESE